jgi:phosphopantothenoylcysteine decarboxylase/phosphopantothenate--cysteine ligase
VTAGPTQEHLDPVRYIGNRSSGKMGFAVAAEAARRGAGVVLIAGPTALTPPPSVGVISVRSAAEMHRAVMDHASEAAVVVMAAAVADYTPTTVAPEKIAKDADELTVRLTRTEDILSALSRLRGSKARPLLVGFAAETTDVVARARAKRRAKGVDLVVANDVSRADAGFDVDDNEVVLVDEGDESVIVTLQPKSGVARLILDRVESLLAAPRRPAVTDPEESLH